MHHHYYVGHFDPCDPFDKSERPCRPKTQHLIARDSVESTLARFDPRIGEYIHYAPEGYVLCQWSHAPYELWENIGHFANALAENENAVVMNEEYVVEFPASARRAQLENWAKRRA